MEGGMESEETIAERRTVARRSNPDRRFAERRMPERATAGRRVQFVPDRRSDDRRQALQPG
ncbi:MAG TPA: hypothetical protein VLR46_09000 [Candidatus Dormibacteraeota bacterium]|nr:hypothetical protein [Candidatus Dormibacteraeota bacterium]